jgi:hypothetical protein
MNERRDSRLDSNVKECSFQQMHTTYRYDGGVGIDVETTSYGQQSFQRAVAVFIQRGRLAVIAKVSEARRN